MLQRITMKTALDFPIPKKVYIIILIYSWSHGGELIHISIMNKFKLVILKLWLLNMVNLNNFDQE